MSSILPVSAVAFVTAIAAVCLVAQPSVCRDKSASFKPGALGMNPPLVTSREDLDKYVGQLVAIRGVVSNTKIATISGVDVCADDHLRGTDAYAVGILAKWVTTREHLDETSKKHGLRPAGP